MKKQLFISLLIIFSLSLKAKAQNTSETDSLYWTALQKYLIQNSDTGSKIIYLELPEGVNTLSGQSSVYTFKILFREVNYFKNYHRFHKNKFNYIEMLPLQINRDELIIGIRTMYGKLKNKHKLISEGREEVRFDFKYDKETKKFIYDKTEFPMSI